MGGRGGMREVQWGAGGAKANGAVGMCIVTVHVVVFLQHAGAFGSPCRSFTPFHLTC